jgi:hypothetical protein
MILTFLVIAAVEIEPEYPENYTYFKLKDRDGNGPRDNSNYKMSNHFRESIDFIDSALESGKCVLVHCRCVLFAFSYLVLYFSHYSCFNLINLLLIKHFSYFLLVLEDPVLQLLFLHILCGKRK